jgi:hypothetical protein
MPDDQFIFSSSWLPSPRFELRTPAGFNVEIESAATAESQEKLMSCTSFGLRRKKQCKFLTPPFLLKTTFRKELIKAKENVTNA